MLNMIGVHAACLALSGQFSPGLHKAYSLFFVVGTIGALNLPLVGWQPFQSLEQLG